MHGLITRLTVILVCFATSFVAIKITSSIRKQNTDHAVATPCEPAVPTSYISFNSPFPETFAPYDIRNFIDGRTQLELTTIWQLLQIRKINLSSSEGFDPAKYPFLQNCHNCKAEAFEYELDGQPGVEILVKISDEVARFSRYLIFGLRGEGRWGEWKLLGHIDSENDKYRMSQHTVFIGGGRSWLTISSQGASGTGVAMYYDRVFLVNRDGVHEVLSYTSQGIQSSWHDKGSREFFGQLVSCELEGDLVTAEIAMAVQYFGEDYLGDGNVILLWEKRQKAFFTRRLGQSGQVLDRSRSTLSERELEEVYNIDSLREEGFFEYNAKELSSVATGKDPSKREWLRRFLGEAEETTPMRRLRQLLSAQK